MSRNAWPVCFGSSGICTYLHFGKFPPYYYMLRVSCTSLIHSTYMKAWKQAISTCMRIALHVYGTLMWSKYSRYNLKSYRCSLREYLRLAYWRLICMRYWVQRITTPLYIHALCSGWFMADWYVISGKSCKNYFLKLIREIFSGLPPPFLRILKTS